MSRQARPEDIDEICVSLPETEPGTSWGDRSTWKVPRGPTGKGFCLYREPHHTAVDPETGEMYDDLVVVITPFFTIDHFRGYNAVLVQQSRLGEISRDELVEVLTDAWARRAPEGLVRKHSVREHLDG